MALPLELESFSIILTRTADKNQRKLDTPLRVLIRDAILRIAQNPLRAGEHLSQPFSSVYSHHVKYKGREYRVAYEINEDAHQVVVLLIGPHENFYRKLKNLLYAS